MTPHSIFARILDFCRSRCSCQPEQCNAASPDKNCDHRRDKFWVAMWGQAARYRKCQNRLGKKHRKIIQRKLPLCSGAIDAALGVIVTIVERFSGRKGKQDKSVSARMLQSAAFLQGMALCEQAIQDGLYVQGGALVRQEMEYIASMEESKQGTRKDNKTPDVNNVPYQLRKAYDQLSKMTHSSSLPMLDALLATTSDPQSMVSVIPEYNNEAARMLLGLHAALLIEFAVQLHVLYTDAYGEGLTCLDRDSLQLARSFLEQEGLLSQLPSDDTTDVYDNDHMQTAIRKAQETLPTFFASLKKSKCRGYRFSLKASFVEGETTEHMWLTDIKVKKGRIQGIVSSVPKYIVRPRFQQRVSITRDQITDWMVEQDGKVVEGGYTVAALNLDSRNPAA